MHSVMVGRVGIGPTTPPTYSRDALPLRMDSMYLVLFIFLI